MARVRHIAFDRAVAVTYPDSLEQSQKKPVFFQQVEEV